jgi:lysophospholipase L1-like esterase
MRRLSILPYFARLIQAAVLCYPFKLYAIVENLPVSPINTAPSKTILCYGDSNTWGYVPAIPDPSKTILPQSFAWNIRWPGRLQKMLGDDFHIIEEGLNARTTNVDHVSPPDRNGKTYLLPCLYSHAPLDLVILMLGGNDMKTYFNRTPADICAGLADLVDTIQATQYGVNFSQAPDILLVAQAPMLPICETFTDAAGVRCYAGGVAKARALPPLIKNLAATRNCYFIDLTGKVEASAIDGMHLDATGHKRVAEVMAAAITQIYSHNS